MLLFSTSNKPWKENANFRARTSPGPQFPKLATGVWTSVSCTSLTPQAGGEAPHTWQVSIFMVTLLSPALLPKSLFTIKAFQPSQQIPALQLCGPDLQCRVRPGREMLPKLVKNKWQAQKYTPCSKTPTPSSPIQHAQLSVTGL